MRVQLRLPAPLGVTALDVPATTTASALVPDEWDAYVRTRRGLVDPSTPLSSLQPNALGEVEVELCARVRGGKGGFGANLRSAGGRMSVGKSTNVDSCKDLHGRRLGTIKEAQKQSELLETFPEMQAKAKAEERARLEALERKLGVSADGGDLTSVDVEELARKRHKFDDNKFLEESREIKDNVRSAVSAALLKKKKKKAPSPDGAKDAAKVAAKKEAAKATPKGASAAPKVAAA